MRVGARARDVSGWSVSVAAVAFLLASSAYLGFQWTVRVVVYPQFATVAAAGFAAYERRHQQLVSVAVGPLFVASGLSAIAVFLRPPGAHRSVAVLAAPALVLLGLGVTAALAVPLHRRLSAGFDAGVHRRLLRVDSVRLVLAALAVVDAVVLLFQR